MLDKPQQKMEAMITAERLAEIISEIQLIPLDQIRPESSLDDLGVDSLGALSIITEIESEFGIKVDISKPIAGLTVVAFATSLNEEQAS